jgi:hypothetical protein
LVEKLGGIVIVETAMDADTAGCLASELLGSVNQN